jgi:hypothetical protein
MLWTVKAEPKSLGTFLGLVISLLQHALDCESRAKESRNFPRTSDKPRNEHHVNMVEYSSESSDDKGANMCVAE